MMGSSSLSKLVLATLAYLVVCADMAVAQNLVLKADSEAAKLTVTLFAKRLLVKSRSDLGTKIGPGESGDKKRLARKIRVLLDDVKEEVNKYRKVQKIKPERNILIEFRVKTVIGTVDVTILIGGTTKGKGNTVKWPLGGGAEDAKQGIFIAIGGDGISGPKPRKGGDATVTLSGGGAAIAYGGKGGDAKLIGKKTPGKPGGSVHAYSGPLGQAVGIGGMGGKGSAAKKIGDKKNITYPGGKEGPGGTGSTSNAKTMVAHGGRGGIGGDGLAGLEGLQPGAKGGNGGASFVATKKHTEKHLRPEKRSLSQGGTRGRGEPLGEAGKATCSGFGHATRCKASPGDDPDDDKDVEYRR